MSVCFYNTHGHMGGIDIHKFQMAVPPDPAPVPLPIFPYAVYVPLSWGICDTKSIVKSVTAAGAPVIQKDHKKKMVPHIFLPIALPHPFQAVQNAAIIASGKTTCVMAVSSVTGGGEALATCLVECWGLNENCDDPIPAPTGHVINPNTVKTTPTAADYVNALLSYADSVFWKLVPKPIRYLRTGLKAVDAIVKLLDKRHKSSPDSPQPLLWSDLEKRRTKQRERYIGKLLGGHQ